MVDAAIIGGLLKTLAPLVKDEFSLLWNFGKEFQKLSSTLSSIDAVLEDAERKTVWEKHKETEDWLRKLKLVAYEVRDIMDEWTLEDLRLQVKRFNASSSRCSQVTNCIAIPFHNASTRLIIGHKIKDVQKKLDQISSERINLHLRESNNGLKSITCRQTISKLSDKTYGRDREEKEIVDILVHSSNVANEVSVLPILGLGGLGKTTLAQLVFNNENVTKHFDAKFWVCVSEEFDIKLIINAIIGTTSETSLEKLHNLIQDNLKGQRYLLVLDDVWNENVEQWKLLRSILDCGSNGAFILTTTRKKRVAEIMKTVEPFELSPISEDDCWLLLEERAFMYGTPKSANFIDIGKEIAIKCKGVPLVAKTLGSQLGFKNDEKEWCRIRDSETWEVSENEESILPILRLSYYDLPYDLRRCFTFCAIFPKDTEIEKEKLIQLWMAHDLIHPEKNQEPEDNGNIIWNELCWRSFFQEEKLNWPRVQTCKMHDLMHDLAQSVMKDECYTMDARSSSKDFEREIRHVTIMNKDFEERLLGSLKNIGGLQSIILYQKNSRTVSKEIFSVLKEFSTLRVFEIFQYARGLDLGFVGCLKHLRYLNISHNIMIKTLPNSVCGLLNLQTLKLDNCSNLECLPRNTKDLINLRHLHLKGCEELKCMPRGIRQLKNLKTFSLFVIGKESDCQLNELKELDIRGYLKIKNLERVSDASIASGISMSKKSSINELELYWGDDTNNGEKKTRHEKIDEALEVSTTCLKMLTLCGYKCVNMPKWVQKSSSSLMRLELREMDNVQHMYTMNTTSEIGMVECFPVLEYLCIEDMKNLRELVSPPIPITTTRAFPNLSRLEIRSCPNLGALPPHLKSLKSVTIWSECSDELVDSIISNHSGLTYLELGSLGERNVLFPGVNNYETLMIDEDSLSSSLDAANNKAQAGGPSTFQCPYDVVLFPLLKDLRIKHMMNLRELVSPVATTTTGSGAFPNLSHIRIQDCGNLRALPPYLKSLKVVSISGECDELLDSIISNQSGVTQLSIGHMDERIVLFPGANNYGALVIDEDEITSSSSLTADNNEARAGGPTTNFQSLQRLFIYDCSKLRCLFDEECEELEASSGERGRRRGSLITNQLTLLYISLCPELMISVEQWRNLVTPSLQHLSILKCPKLVPSKEEEAEEVIALLRSLRARLGPENIDVDFLLNEEEGGLIN